MADTNHPTVKISTKEFEARARTVSLVYPIDLGSEDESKYTIFKIYQYSKIEVNAVELKTQLGSIFLPIPPELSNSDSLKYQEFSAPLINAGLESLHKDGTSDAFKGLSGALVVAGASAISKIPGFGNVANQVAALSGASVNPRNTNVFQSPEAREHRYTFRMIAKSQEESIAIRKIINKFRFHSYPDNALGEALYLAPDLFKISFKVGDTADDDPDTFLFHPLPSALIAMSVSYNGTSTPSFFQESNAPVEVVLTLIFKEMELDSKSKLQSRYGKVDDGFLPDAVK